MEEKERLTEKDKTLIYKEENTISLRSEKNKKSYYYGKPIDKLAEYEDTGLSPKEVEDLKNELEVYKNAWERFIDFFATKDCEWDAWESGGAIYGDACFHSGHGPHKKYREKYEKEQKDCLSQARKELENERNND